MVQVNENYLDSIREKHGYQKLMLEWMRLVEMQREKAIQLINQDSLTFTTLFLLSDKLQENLEDDELSNRNRIALHHINNVLRGEERGVFEQKHFNDQHHEVIYAFKWIFKSGGRAFISPSYIQTIDSAAVLLLLTYKENVKKDVVDLLFLRHRYQTYRHYLTWVFLESCEPKDLFYICHYLNSSNKRDQTLAKRLLNFIPNIDHEENPTSAYMLSRTWLEDNVSYLVYSGETNDMKPTPNPFLVEHAAKYLGIALSSDTGSPLCPLNTFETKRWQDFSTQLSEEAKGALANFSHKYRLIDSMEWSEWIKKNLNLQLVDIREED